MKNNIAIIGLGGAGKNVLNDFCLLNQSLGEFIFFKNFKSLPTLKDKDFIFVISGLGGKTTSVKLPKLATKLLKSNSNVYFKLISPFEFEGRELKVAQALESLKNLGCYIDIYSNAVFASKFDKDATFKELFYIIHQQIYNDILKFLVSKGK